MSALRNPSEWSFEVGAFLVLLGEQEEVNYRLMQRSWVECLVATPVAGLQSYMRSHITILQYTMPASYRYKSPYGCKDAELRNFRMHRTISVNKLLNEGRARVYRALSAGESRTRSSWALLYLWVLATWILFAGILTWTTIFMQRARSTWIGLSNCVVYVCWSIALRIVDKYLVESMISNPTDPDSLDAAIFLGRRHSCLIIEGSRSDIARWTGTGLAVRACMFADPLALLSRIVSTAILLWIFVTIPNGTTFDQLAFILLCLLGQVNVALGQRFNAAMCQESFEPVASLATPTRTHVYAALIRRYGDGPWVSATQLLPETVVWSEWKGQVRSSDEDPKQLYTKIAAAHAGSRSKAVEIGVSEKLQPSESV